MNACSGLHQTQDVLDLEIVTELRGLLLAQVPRLLPVDQVRNAVLCLLGR